MNPRARFNQNGSLSRLGYGFILALLVLAGLNLLGPVLDWHRLDKQLEESRLRLDELQVLYPVYVELASMDRPAKWPSLTLPRPQKLTEAEVTAITDRFMQLAARCQVELGTVSPRVATEPVSGRRCLNVELQGTGPYRQLKDLLIGLAQMPTLERIVALEIRRETLHEQFTIVAQLALE